MILGNSYVVCIAVLFSLRERVSTDPTTHHFSKIYHLPESSASFDSFDSGTGNCIVVTCNSHIMPLLALKVVLSSQTKSCEIQLLNSLVAIQYVSSLQTPTNQRHPTKEPCSKRTAKWAWPWACFSFAVSNQKLLVVGGYVFSVNPYKSPQLDTWVPVYPTLREPTFRMHLMFKKVMAYHFNKDMYWHMWCSWWRTSSWCNGRCDCIYDYVFCCFLILLRFSLCWFRCTLVYPEKKNPNALILSQSEPWASPLLYLLARYYTAFGWHGHVNTKKSPPSATILTIQLGCNLVVNILLFHFNLCPNWCADIEFSSHGWQQEVLMATSIVSI